MAIFSFFIKFLHSYEGNFAKNSAFCNLHFVIRILQIDFFYSIFYSALIQEIYIPKILNILFYSSWM